MFFSAQNQKDFEVHISRCQASGTDGSGLEKGACNQASCVPGRLYVECINRGKTSRLESAVTLNVALMRWSRAVAGAAVVAAAVLAVMVSEVFSQVHECT